MNNIAIPAVTQARLEKLLTDRQTLQAVIDVTIQTMRETLAVPAGWTMNNLAEGFVGPPEQPASPAVNE